LALTTPVLVDQAAMFVGLVWCLLVTARAPWLRRISPLAVLLLIPTRETWVLPLLLATGVLWWTRQRILASATLLATVVAGAFTLTRPSAPGRFDTVLKVLHDGRVSLMHPDQAVWIVFFGVGFLAFLAVLLLARPRRLRGPTGIVFAIACAQLVQAPLSGSDSRYAAAALPFAIALAIAATVEVGTRRVFWALIALTSATMLLWQPFRTAGAGVRSYVSMYYPSSATATAVALGGLLLIAAALVWVLRGDGAVAESAAEATP
jgi:hypothetical protein